MKIEFEEIAEHDDGSATFTFTGSKEDMDAFMSAMFNNFLVNAVKLTKESDVKILDDLNDHWTQITYDDYDTLQNKLIQVKGILSLAMEAYSGFDHEDLNGSLWAACEMVEDALKVLDK
jgi:hypothetical protein